MYTLAAWTTFAAAAAMLASGTFLVLMFAGAGPRFGPLNDAFTFIFLLLMLPAVVAAASSLDGESVIVARAIALIGLVGVVVAASAPLLLLRGAIRLETSFVLSAIGFPLALTWALLLSLAAALLGDLHRYLGWAGAMLGAGALLMLLGQISARRVVMLAGGAVTAVALSAWMVLLGLALAERGV